MEDNGPTVHPINNESVLEKEIEKRPSVLMEVELKSEKEDSMIDIASKEGLGGLEFYNSNKFADSYQTKYGTFVY